MKDTASYFIPIARRGHAYRAEAKDEELGKRLWAYENITANQRRIGSAEALYELLKKVVDVFSHQDPDLRQRWGETALKWATCCSVRHLACRSFQCFRALMPHFNQIGRAHV